MQRRIAVNLPEGQGLRFWKLTGREAVSEPFVWTLTLLGEDARINRSNLLGKSATVTLPTQNGLASRYLNGKVTRVAVSPVELSGTRYAAYTLTVEPDLWPMKLDRNMRIFQGKTVPEIVKEVLNEYQVKVDDKLTENFRIWDYSVQYQESSLDFISRLLEQEGIAWHFRHSEESHTLVLTDAGSQYQPFEGYETIPYHQTSSGGSTTEEGISQWSMENRVTPGLYSLDDYDFRKPNAWLFQARQNSAAPQPGTVDVYDWPGRYVDHNQGEAYARVNQERWQVEHQQTFGTGTATGIAPGHIFQLINAPFAEDNGNWLVTDANYYFEENQYASSDSGSSEHHTDFTVVPASIAHRPARKTAWPRTYGPQTARVVGPAGESIWTDRYGRVKVKFHWDRQAKGDDTSSCWIRVSSAWAGQGFGGVQIPRVGDEVVVDFINGDPDRPIITGRVYNESSMPPWELPAAATMMGFMTRSKDGHKDNSSYLFFEDNPGNERIDLHSEKDMHISVENDKTVNIDGSRTTNIKRDQKDDVTGDATFHYHKTRTTTVDEKETKTFNNGEQTTVFKGRQLDIDNGDKVYVKQKRDTTIEGDETHHVTQRITENYDLGQTTIVGGDGRNETINGGVVINVPSGNWEQNVKGGTITIFSPNEITLRSTTKINLDAPNIKSKAKAHNESFTGNSLSLTGASQSLTGFSMGVTAVSVSTTPLSVSLGAFSIKNKGFELKRVNNKVDFYTATNTSITSIRSFISTITTFL